ncbi:dinitrogenase iron-molybdenum cofactor biosynthesis protein [Gordonibacter sp. An230]|uniref:NifB/NifX family molybdenum-iron cluster-binding protein n=1 Tax=Gordonibacter sp. An230 TaxID=1965592 RepID=UPI000B39A3E5|nr:NifB/NifX family molybdenum-iron cluster-binding protein [Gordonibacter sp. An230]OUO90883.1 dinitrogenase iron-molybdenum cofactor biosynthesis protein [Gordonibacter sp. An230]
MRIAVASEGLNVSPHFGQCASFTCYTIDRGMIVECQNTPNPRLPPRQLASMLGDLDVRVLVAGCVERDALDALGAEGIEVVPCASGTARGAAEAYLARTLAGDGEWHGEEEGRAVHGM